MQPMPLEFYFILSKPIVILQLYLNRGIAIEVIWSDSDGDWPPNYSKTNPKKRVAYFRCLEFGVNKCVLEVANAICLQASRFKARTIFQDRTKISLKFVVLWSAPIPVACRHYESGC